MDDFMNQSVPASDHFLNISVEIQPQSAVIARIGHINNVFVPLEQGVVQKIEQFHTLQRHLHHHFNFQPKLPYMFGQLLLALSLHQNPP